MSEDTAAQESLFDVPELERPLGNGRTEAGLHRALVVAAEAGRLQPEDAGLVAGALVAARALDRAEGLADKAAPYAVAQLLPQYQKALHGLRLPQEVAAVGGPPTPLPTPEGSGAADFLGELFGPS